MLAERIIAYRMRTGVFVALSTHDGARYQHRKFRELRPWLKWSKNVGLVELHRVAREIFDHALGSVDPRRALRDAVTLDGTLLRICDTVFNTSLAQIMLWQLARLHQPWRSHWITF